MIQSEKRCGIKFFVSDIIVIPASTIFFFIYNSCWPSAATTVSRGKLPYTRGVWVIVGWDNDEGSWGNKLVCCNIIGVHRVYTCR